MKMKQNNIQTTHVSSGIDISILLQQEWHNVSVAFLRCQVKGCEPILENKMHHDTVITFHSLDLQIKQRRFQNRNVRTLSFTSYFQEVCLL